MSDRRTLRRVMFLSMMFIALLLPISVDAPVEAGGGDCEWGCIEAHWDGVTPRCTQFNSSGCVVCTFKCEI